MPYFTARDGASLYVRIVGRGRPLILLHGFGMHSAHWLPFIWPLRKEFRIIMPDLRGFGRSARVRHNQRSVLCNYAEDLDDILNALQLRSVNLAGISMGAFTALQYLRKFGTRRINAYLNIDQSPCVLNSEEWNHGLFGPQGRWKMPALARLHQQAKGYDPALSFDELPGHFRDRFHQELGDFIAFALEGPRQKAWVRRLCRYPAVAERILPGESWHAYLRCLGSYLEEDYDMRKLAASLNLPVYVLAGRRSEMYPWQGQRWLAENCPYGHFIPFERSGHLPMLDEPQRFVATLRQIFLEGSLARQADWQLDGVRAAS